MKIIILIVFTALCGLAYLLSTQGFQVSTDGIRLSRNFHEVDAGKLYRSAQLKASELKEYLPKHGIKTVINLQGRRPETEWYQNEELVTSELGIKLINIEMTVESIPKRFELLKLLEAYKNAERPILVHCRQGTDRTGEAVAIYMMEYMGKTLEEALSSFSSKYFYVEAFAPAKKFFVENYKGKQWAYEEYFHCDKSWKLSDQRECPPL